MPDSLFLFSSVFKTVLKMKLREGNEWWEKKKHKLHFRLTKTELKTCGSGIFLA